MRRAALLALLLPVVGGGGWLAWRFLAENATGDVPPPAGSKVAASAIGETAVATDDAARPRPPELDVGSDEAATRTVEKGDPFDLPAPAALRMLEASGRALLVGVVTGFDLEPCPGAKLFHNGVPVGVSDAQGCFRLDVEQNSWNSMSASRWSNVLAAVKEGVGAGSASCDGSSRRVDVALQWRALFAGRCVERGSGKPVAQADVELLSFLGERRTALFGLATRTDEKGAFRFVGIAPGIAELRARAAGFASDGWFPFDVSAGADRTNVEFVLERIVHAHGWFSPWPPPWLNDHGAAREARVVAIPAAGRESAPESEPVIAPVAADGAFDAAFPACNGIDLVLEAGGGALWQEHIACDWETPDLDLGRIPLAAPAAITGTVGLPRDLLELGFELLVVVRTYDDRRVLRFPVGLDGRFRAEPLPPGRLLWGVVLGDELVIERTLTVFSGERNVVFGDEQELEGGTLLDLGTVAAKGRIVAGRVTDAAGASVRGATIQIPVATRDGLVVLGGFSSECDGKGRYVVQIGMESDSSGSAIEVALSTVPVALCARTRGGIGRSPPFLFPADGEAARRDLKLEPGLELRGRALDAAGRPLAGATIDFVPDFQHFRSALFIDESVTTDADGAFELGGLEEVDYLANALVDDEWVHFGRARPGEAPVTLSPVTLTPNPGE